MGLVMRNFYFYVSFALVLALSGAARAEEFITNEVIENEDGTLSIGPVRQLGSRAAESDAHATRYKEVDLKIGPSRDEFRKEIESHAKDVPQSFKKALEAQVKGQLNKAISYYEKSIENNPGYLSAYNNLLVCLISRNRPGDLNSAKGVLDKADGSGGKNSPSIWCAKAALCEANGKPLERIECLRKALYLQPNTPDTVFALAEAYDRQKEIFNAYAVLSASKRYSSTWSPEEQVALAASLRAHEAYKKNN
jgi:tetratricopeptide (TPR) repeat protein